MTYSHTCAACGRHLPMHRKPKARACNQRCRLASEQAQKFIRKTECDRARRQQRRANPWQAWPAEEIES